MKPKGHRHGTHRAVAPAQTLERLGARLPVAGITRVADITGLDRIGIPVVMVVRPNARSLSVSQGKGIDLAAARVSGVMEAVEQFAAEAIDAPLHLGSRHSLASLGGRDATLDPVGVPRLATSRWSDDHRTLWIAAEVLASDPVAGDRSLLVPYELVHLDFTLPLPEGSGCFPMSSSGLASGNHRDEATCHAICELIERDAVTLRTQLAANTSSETASSTASEVDGTSRRLDLDTVDDEACRDLLARFQRAEVEVAVWDATSEIGVATFECALLDRHDAAAGVLGAGVAAGGSGCHLDRGVALARALTEAAQSRLTMIAGARDDLDRDAYERWRDPDHLAALREQYATEPATRRFEQAPTGASDDFETDLATLLDRLRATGFPTALRVDLTPPWLADVAAVVRVVVPGLEGLDLPGAVPGERRREVMARALAELRPEHRESA